MELVRGQSRLLYSEILSQKTNKQPCFVYKSDLELLIILLVPSECQDCRHVPLGLTLCGAKD